MSTDLTDLVPYLTNRLNGPGGTFFDGTANEWKLSLANAFWEAKSAGGFFSGYRELDFEIHNVSSGPDMSRELQQVVIMWAAYQVVFAKLMAQPSREKSSVAPGLETEVEHSTNLLILLLKSIREDLEKARSEALGTRWRTEVGVIDGVLARGAAIAGGYTSIVL